MIKSMDYCRVVSDKKLKGSGLVRGDVVLVVGTGQVPASAKDPYLLRTLCVVARVVDDLPQLGDGSEKLMVDPRSLEKVSEKEGKRLNKALEKKYGPNDSTD